MLAYSDGVEGIGQMVADTFDTGSEIVIPVVCLLEAYRILDHTEHHRLGPLRANPVIRIADVFDGPGDAPPIIGGLAVTASRLGAAHAIWMAMCGRAAVVTSQPDQIRSVLGDSWPLVEV
ncbi:hypothetical protein [Actinoplanes sp. G11-F43]|uniref:hypothetical protein n=1 Tax=Actinoplanes sp. G11-F43 TaxID=3424130 RepID=UPI003D345664